MDLHLKQCRNQNQSDQHPPPKMPKLLLDSHYQQQEEKEAPPSGYLPLFASDPNCKISNLSAISTAKTTAARFPGMGSYFSLAQWQELELQALIYRYMLAGAAVPPELLHPIKKSLLCSPPYFLHHPLRQFSHCEPARYWGRVAMDPEPGRCRRTDGKKWRCSRDVVAGQKYCERHVHRGRSRSRKPVEIPTTASSAAALGGGIGGSGGTAFSTTSTLIDAAPLIGNASGTTFSSVDLLHHLNHSISDSKSETNGLFGPQNEIGNRSDAHILRHFFDDWPRSLQEPENAGINASSMNSATCLSISMPGNSSSDVSLKLSTGNGEETASTRRSERGQQQLNWSSHHVTSMGGPLAEALRLGSSNSSPASVLHQLSRASASETRAIST